MTPESRAGVHVPLTSLLARDDDKEEASGVGDGEAALLDILMTASVAETTAAASASAADASVSVLLAMAS